MQLDFFYRAKKILILWLKEIALYKLSKQTTTINQI